MEFDKLVADVMGAVLTFLQALVPAAIGSAVSQAYKKGLSWGERLLQWLVGISVSWFVTLAVEAIWSPGEYLKQAVSFVVAMIAFEAAPKFIRSAGDAIAKLPEIASSWLSKKSGTD